MRRILYSLLLLPLIAAAEIPLVSPTIVASLTRADGQTFSGRLQVRMSGDEIAVLDQADASFEPGGSAIHVFARQGDGSWMQTHKFNTPGLVVDRLRDFAFGGDVILVTRRPRDLDYDGINNLAFVAERINGNWVNTTQLPGLVHGMVMARNNWIALSRLRGVEMFQRVAPGVWQSSSVLPENGASSVGDNVSGPAFDFDGERVIIGTNIAVSDPKQGFYIAIAGRLYERDSSGRWVLAAQLSTPLAFYSTGGVHPVSASIAGNDLAIAGFIYRNDGYGYWEQTADLSPISESLAASSGAALGSSGLGLVGSRSGTDLYARGSDGFWRPRLRLAPDAPGIVAREGARAVGIYRTPGADVTLPGTARLLVLDLAATADKAHEPASISNIGVSAAAVQPTSQAVLTAFTYVGEAGDVTVRSVEFRVGAGAWQPMSPRDGAFDAAFESVSVVADFPTQLSGSVPICFRVTDSAGRQSELLDRGHEPCPIVEGKPQPPFFIPVGDLEPPVVSELLLWNTRVAPGQDNVINAFADDYESGEICTGQPGCVPSYIMAMQFRIDSGVWRAMKPWPGFRSGDFFFRDAEYEAAHGELPPAHGIGVHSVCVRAMDTFGNVSSPQCVSYEVVP